MEMVSMTNPDLVGKLTKSRAWEGTAFDFETLRAADALRLKTWHSCFNRSRPLTRAGLLPAALDGARASR